MDESLFVFFYPGSSEPQSKNEHSQTEHHAGDLCPVNSGVGPDPNEIRNQGKEGKQSSADDQDQTDGFL